MTRAWLGDERTYLEVEDDGPGLDPAVVDRVFEPLVTAKAARHGPRPRAQPHHRRGARRRDHRDHAGAAGGAAFRMWLPERVSRTSFAPMQTEAMVLDRHGGPEVLERRTIELDAPGPVPGARARARGGDEPHGPLGPARRPARSSSQYPHRLGCDIAGVVEELGPGARGVAVGDRVMVQPGLSCGVCKACLSGRDNLCRSYRILGENAQGGYARHVNLPDVNLVEIGARARLRRRRGAAALHADRVADGLREGRRRAPVRRWSCTRRAAASRRSPSSSASSWARASSPRPARPSKRERARALGADEVIVTSEQDYVGGGQAAHRQGGRRRRSSTTSAASSSRRPSPPPPGAGAS